MASIASRHHRQRMHRIIIASRQHHHRISVASASRIGVASCGVMK
jgi:hypothetical protein